MKYVNKQILSITDAVSQNSSAVDASQLISSSFHFVFSDADAAGSVKIQASNDVCADGMAPSSFAVTNWIDVPNQSATITAGSAALLTIANMSYRWVRAAFTQTTPGTGTLRVNMFGVSV